jgi:hypothetical protein
MTGIFSQDIKSKYISNFLEDVANTSSNYYVTFGKFFSWPDDNSPPATNSAISSIHYDVNRNMMYGKKLDITDLAYIVENNTWTSGTVYDFYDDQDPDIYSKQFYVVTSLFRVYKCLFNNYGAPSTVEPDLTINSGDFDTADGYKWKYLYTINSAERKKFNTDSYIPVISSDVVSQFAESGAVHVIPVTNSGNNYISANGYIFNVINSYSFQVSNSNASIISGAYTGSTFYVYSGGAAGTITTVNDYVVNSTGKFVFTADPITSIDSTSLYRIEPQVYVDGDGYGLKAICSVDPVSGGITSIDVIKRGLNYSYANISIVANTFFGYGSSARAIISPRDGHGSDVVSELGCEVLGISLSTNLTDNFQPWINYRQIALIHNPIASANLSLYADPVFNQMTNFGVASAPSFFDSGEVVQGFNSKATATVAYMDSNVLYVLNDQGTFQPFETLISTSTGKTCVISAINTKDLVPFTSQVLYYKNIEPINREGVNSEEVKLYFNF